MGLFDSGKDAKSTGHAGHGRPGLFSFAAAAQLAEPGTPTFTRRVPVRGGTVDRFERWWSAIRQNEGGIGPRGEMLTSEAGAVGPGQVLPSTGPEAARLANLPWDEHRFRTDARYNEALGRAYFREQLRVFGDPAMAAAAYNAGPPAMRRALRLTRRHGGPWDHHLPAETKIYLKDFRAKVGK